jgi:glycerol-3-phosphate O-acyltransferase
MALPVWTLQLCPRPMILPSWTSTDPIGIPPSARLFSACSIAAARLRRRSRSAAGSFSSRSVFRSFLHFIDHQNHAAALNLGSKSKPAQLIKNY